MVSVLHAGSHPGALSRNIQTPLGLCHTLLWNSDNIGQSSTISMLVNMAEVSALRREVTHEQPISRLSNTRMFFKIAQEVVHFSVGGGRDFS